VKWLIVNIAVFLLPFASRFTAFLLRSRLSVPHDQSSHIITLFIPYKIYFFHSRLHPEFNCKYAVNVRYVRDPCHPTCLTPARRTGLTVAYQIYGVIHTPVSVYARHSFPPVPFWIILLRNRCLKSYSMWKPSFRGFLSAAKGSRLTLRRP
jgi:hypothetical protein